MGARMAPAGSAHAPPAGPRGLLPGGAAGPASGRPTGTRFYGLCIVFFCYRCASNSFVQTTTTSTVDVLLPNAGGMKAPIDTHVRAHTSFLPHRGTSTPTSAPSARTSPPGRPSCSTPAPLATKQHPATCTRAWPHCTRCSSRSTTPPPASPHCCSTTCLLKRSRTCSTCSMRCGRRRSCCENGAQWRTQQWSPPACWSTTHERTTCGGRQYGRWAAAWWLWGAAWQVACCMGGWGRMWCRTRLLGACQRRLPCWQHTPTRRCWPGRPTSWHVQW